MKDNFSNKNPFGAQRSPFSQSLDNYVDLVNQPSPAEPYAQAFTKAGSAPANGPMGHQANAILTGMGAGIQGYVNRDKEEQLRPALREAGRIFAKAAELEAQMQLEQQRKFTGNQFVRNNASLITALGQSSSAGDLIASSGQAKALGETYQKAFGVELGQFDSYDPNTRRIFYSNGDGSVVGYGIADAIREYAQDVYGEQTSYMLRQLDPYYKEQYENTEQVRKLAIEKEKANIANQYSQANYHNAQTSDVYNKMNAPAVDEYAQKLNFEVLKDRASKNYTLVQEKIVPRIEADERVLSVYDSLDKIAQESRGLTGGDYMARMRRGLAEAVGFSDAAKIDYAKLKSVEFEKMLKPILGAQLGEKEGERILSKFPSIETNPDALRKFLSEEMPKLVNDIVRNRQKVEYYSKESHGNLFDDSIHRNLENDAQAYLQKRGGGNNINDTQHKNFNSSNNDDMVQVISPSGKVGMIPRSSLQNAMQKGFKVQE
jgi:hypothetical protein